VTKVTESLKPAPSVHRDSPSEVVRDQNVSWLLRDGWTCAAWLAGRRRLQSAANGPLTSHGVLQPGDRRAGTSEPAPALSSDSSLSGNSLSRAASAGRALLQTLSSQTPTDPAAAPIVGVQAKNISNGAGSFTGGPLAGKMALKGTAITCLLGSALGCSNTVTNGGPTANLVVPFTQNGTRGVGLGGGPIIPKAAAGIHLTVNGNTWAQTAALNTGMGTIKVVGFIHGPASGGAATAGQASGVVELVTPTLISTSIGASATIPSFAVLNLHFTTTPVPEPGTLLLLSSGVVGLVVLGRRRMNK